MCSSDLLEWDLGGGGLKMSDCWINIMPQGVTHSPHLHPNSVVSGTYYVATPRGCAGLKFEDPRMSRFMATPPVSAEGGRPSRRHVTYPATAGNVTLFESWLRHEVPAAGGRPAADELVVLANRDDDDRDGRPDASDLLNAGGDSAQTSCVQPLLQTLPLDVLHDQVRQACHVAGSDKPRNMRAVDEIGRAHV